MNLPWAVSFITGNTAYSLNLYTAQLIKSTIKRVCQVRHIYNRSDLKLTYSIIWYNSNQTLSNICVNARANKSQKLNVDGLIIESHILARITTVRFPLLWGNIPSRKELTEFVPMTVPILFMGLQFRDIVLKRNVS